MFQVEVEQCMESIEKLLKVSVLASSLGQGFGTPKKQEMSDLDETTPTKILDVVRQHL